MTDETTDETAVGDLCAASDCLYQVVRPYESPLCPRCHAEQSETDPVM